MREQLSINELLTPNDNTIKFGTAAPTTGTYKVGDIVINTTPVAGSAFAWSCSVAGTPGTWIEPPAMASVTATAAEINYNDIATPGTLAASKTWTADANLDTVMPTGGKLTVQSGGDVTLESGSTLDVAGTFEIANVAMTATAAELNYNDIVALGTGAASKAVVLDAGEDYRWPAAGVLHAGVITAVQSAPAAKTVTAAITAAELAGGLITTTGVTAPSIHQLPTGTLIDAQFPGMATGDSFDFTIINTGVGATDDATITVNTDVTIVGNPTVGALTDATILSGSGTFRARRSAANAYVVYRIA